MAPQDTVLKLDFATLDVFTDTRFLGNPLAVVFVPAALRSQLSQETKQRIAREFNLSETVFLHTLDNEPQTSATTREIDIFTTEKELPFAGHPTIGSAYLVLKHLGWSHVDTLLTKAGPIRIAPLEGDTGNNVRAEIPHDVHIHQQTLGGLLDSADVEPGVVSLVRNALSDDPVVHAAELAATPVSIVKGMTFVLVKLLSLDHLARVPLSKRLDFSKVTGLLDEGDWSGGFVSRYYYVPTSESSETAATESDKVGGVTIRARMVELGFEDPATGSAACTLASYLAISGRKVPGVRFAVTQGVEMGRQSEISVEVTTQENGGEVAVKELFLGGTAVVVMSGSISV